MVCGVNSVVHPCFLICGFMFCLLVVDCAGLIVLWVIGFWVGCGLFAWFACCYVCGFACGLFAFGALYLLVGWHLVALLWVWMCC